MEELRNVPAEMAEVVEKAKEAVAEYLGVEYDWIYKDKYGRFTEEMKIEHNGRKYTIDIHGRDNKDENMELIIWNEDVEAVAEWKGYLYF